MGFFTGLLIRHYLDEQIPFERIFSKLEYGINSIANFLYRLKHNRIIRLFGKIIKKFLCAIFKVLKWVGTLIYKNRIAIGKSILNFAKATAKTITGADLAEYQCDNSLIILCDEEERFTEQFAGHPYDTPLFIASNIIDGVCWYDYQAIRLAKRYEDLSPKTLTRMLENQIQMYMKSTRMTKVDIFVKMATPTRFYFGIALSKHGQKELAKLRQNQVIMITEEATQPLEEEIIDLFSIDEETEL